MEKHKRRNYHTFHIQIQHKLYNKGKKCRSSYSLIYHHNIHLIFKLTYIILINHNPEPTLVIKHLRNKLPSQVCKECIKSPN